MQTALFIIARTFVQALETVAMGAVHQLLEENAIEGNASILSKTNILERNNMSYCNKEIKADDVLNNMSKDDLEFTLASCEQSCDRYYSCDTVLLMNDKLK